MKARTCVANGRILLEPMKAAGPPERTIHDVADDINTRALEHGSVAKTMRAIFDECSSAIQPDADRDAEWPNQLFEGLVVIEKYLERDSVEIMELVGELRRKFNAGDEKGGRGER